MRIIRIVAGTLFIGAITLLCSSCSSKNDPVYGTDATIKDIMDSVVDPNADYIWDSVSSELTVKGWVDKAPKTDDDWKELRRHAIALMEATNMIQIPGRRVARPGEKAADPRVEEPPEVITTMIDSDRVTWSKHAHELYDVTAEILKAVDAKNTDMIFTAGDRIDKACENCHLVYWYPNQNGPGDGVKHSGSERKAP